jgi:hypothetical protein
MPVPTVNKKGSLGSPAWGLPSLLTNDLKVIASLFPNPSKIAIWGISGERCWSAVGQLLVEMNAVPFKITAFCVALSVSRTVSRN